MLLQNSMYLTDVLGTDFGFDFDACRNKIDLIILDLTNNWTKIWIDKYFEA